MRSRALLGCVVLMAAYWCAWACGGDTKHSSGSVQGDPEGSGGRSEASATGGTTGAGGDETGGSGPATGGVPVEGGASNGATGGVAAATSSGGDDSGGTGNGAGLAPATGGTSVGAAPGVAGSGPSGGSGAVGVGGSGATATGEDFIWSGYDVSDVELDESASGIPVPEGNPGNAYGQTVIGEMMPIIGQDCPEGGYGVSSMCMEFMVCEYHCTTAADCPQVSTGTAVPQCADPFGSDRCSLPCGGSLVCPDGMACIWISSGFFCAWPSPMLMPGCPGYCAQLDEHCDGRTTGECCDGLVCAPWDQCEEGTCLRLSWPCSDDTAPCCEGMACVDGYCT